MKFNKILLSIKYQFHKCFQVWEAYLLYIIINTSTCHGPNVLFWISSITTRGQYNMFIKKGKKDTSKGFQTVLGNLHIGWRWGDCKMKAKSQELL